MQLCEHGQVRIITANIRGLYPRTFKRKVNILADFAYSNNVGFIILTESHLRPEILDAEIAIENYHLYRADRANRRKKGGVITYVRNDLAGSCQELLATSNGAVECTLLHIESLNLIIGGVYRPPVCVTSQFTDTINKIHGEIIKLGDPAPNILITGDFNMPNAPWQSLEMYGGSDSIRRQAEALFNFSMLHALEQVITKATRGDNILDLCFTNNDELIDQVRIEDSSLSDHKLIFLTTNIHLKQNVQSNNINNTDDQPPLRSLNFYRETINWDLINNKFLHFDWDGAFMNLSTDEILRVLQQIILTISQEYVPMKRKHTKQARTIPRDRRLLMKKRTKITRQLSRATGPGTRERLMARLAELEKDLAESHRAERQRDENRAVASIKTNPKYFYSYARSKAKIKGEVGPFKENHKIITDPKEKSEILRRQFESVYSKPMEEYEEAPDETIASTPSETLDDVDFREDDFVRSIADLSTASAAGPDGIPAVLLKKCANSLKRPLLLLWKKSMDSGEIPKELKNGLVTPIFKGGERSIPKNYRPVALTSHIIKIFEKIIVNRIVEHLERNELYNDSQHGFRRGRSCLSQLLEHYHRIVKALADGSSVDVVYLDFAKAFDKVDHKVLLRKLRRLGIGGKLLKWIRCFLTGRKQSVAVEGTRSGDSEVISGVPQGSVLGPLLFLIHISDIDSGISHATLSSFADDTRVLMEIRRTEDRVNMQTDLNTIYSWAAKNSMEFNGAKFEAVEYRGRHDLGNSEYMATDGSTIQRKMELRDLGVVMQETATFEHQVQAMAARARKQMGWVLRTFATREPAPMLTLYKSMILPLLEYACQLWAPTSPGLIRMLEGVQRTYTARIFGLKGLDYWQRLNKLKLYSLERRRERYMILYVFKILMGLAPNIKVEGLEITEHKHIRRGKLCKIPGMKRRADCRVQSVREKCFALCAPRLFNSLPQYLRDFSGTLESFKNKLDSYLQSVPDRPILPHYYQIERDNGLISQSKHSG